MGLVDFYGYCQPLFATIRYPPRRSWLRSKLPWGVSNCLPTIQLHPKYCQPVSHPQSGTCHAVFHAKEGPFSVQDDTVL
jgi:hypothetical protein